MSYLEIDHLELLRTWSKIINEYSHLELSKSGDILPAISGIAKSFGTATGWEYVAGMWKETMPRSLLWYTDKPSYRRVPWQAPTFSWASTHSDSILLANEDWITMLAEVIETETCPIGDDSTGQLQSGHIILSGTVVRATLRYPQRADSGYEVETLYRKGTRTVRVRLSEDFDLMQSDHEVHDGETVSCLKMCWTSPPDDCEYRISMYLVLLGRGYIPWESSGLGGGYGLERIGVFKDRDIAHRRDGLSFEQSSPEDAVRGAIVRII